MLWELLLIYTVVEYNDEIEYYAISIIESRRLLNNFIWIGPTVTASGHSPIAKTNARGPLPTTSFVLSLNFATITKPMKNHSRTPPMRPPSVGYNNHHSPRTTKQPATSRCASLSRSWKTLTNTHKIATHLLSKLMISNFAPPPVPTDLNSVPATSNQLD